MNAWWIAFDRNNKPLYIIEQTDWTYCHQNKESAIYGKIAYSFNEQMKIGYTAWNILSRSRKLEIHEIIAYRMLA